MNVPSPVGSDSSQQGCAGNELHQPACCPLGGPGPDGRMALALPSLHRRLPLLGPVLASFSAQPVTPSSPRFMEFEAEEEMQTQKLQWMKEAQGQPPPAPPRPDPRGPPAPVVGPHPGTATRSHRSPRPGATGPRAGRCPHIGPSPSRGFGLSTGTAMRARASAAPCHHEVWTWSAFITPLPPPC